jgi:hypothetical protein
MVVVAKCGDLLEVLSLHSFDYRNVKEIFFVYLSITIEVFKYPARVLINLPTSYASLQDRYRKRDHDEGLKETFASILHEMLHELLHEMLCMKSISSK